MMEKQQRYAVYEEMGGVFCALSVAECNKRALKQLSPMFRSIGRAIVEKQELERRSKAEAI